MDSVEIAKFVRQHGSKEFKKRFLGVYPADEVKNFERKILKQKNNINLSCCIMNTDRSDKIGQHWVSLVALDGDSAFLFDSFGRLGFKQFFIGDDQETISHFLTMEPYLKANEDNKKIGISKLTFHNKV